MGALYRLDFPNGKSYVGITSDAAEARFKVHVGKARSPNSWAVHKAINKYGADSVRVVTLAIADSWEYLCLIERKAIDVFGTFGKAGYNLTAGGDGFRGEHTQDTKDKISAANKGRVFSKETCALISAAKKGKPGKPLTDEAKRNLSAINTGRTFSESTREKISASMRGRKMPDSTKEKLRATYATRAGRQTPTADEIQRSRVKQIQHAAGVTFNKRAKKWIAHLRVNGRSSYLGGFTDKEGALKARAKAVAEYMESIK